MSRGPLPSIDGLTSLKVDGFFPDTRKDEVWDFFRKCGRIGDVYLPREPGTGKGRGFAFVRFYERKDAEMAVQDMDGKEFQGSRLRVNFAQVGRNTEPTTSHSLRVDNRRKDRRSSSGSSRSHSSSASRGRGRDGGGRHSRSRDAKRGHSDSRDRRNSGRKKTRRSPSKASSRSRSRSRSRGRR